jgi:DNA mismatch repair protein MutL
VRVDAGTLVSVREVGAPEGTLVEVADLFHNLPARRKFLKADTAEAAQVSRLVTQLALGYADVGFVLKSGSRLLLEAPPAGSLEERFYQIYGERADLVRVQKHAAGVSVQGYVAALTDQGPVRGPQHVFVNGRIVRDRTITHAIQQAYSTATIKERSPEVHLFVELPADRVDVNVHPTKAEVRFLDQGLVHEILRRAVVDALGGTGVPELVLAPAAEVSAPLATGALPLGFAPSTPAGVGVASWPNTDPASAAEGRGPDSDRLSTRAGDVSVAHLIRPMAPLGQFRNTFIIAVDDEGLAIVDQHVAHERILFEQISARLAGQALESQGLVSPVVLELGAGEHQTLLQHRSTLERFGFEVDDFGGTSVSVSAVPALLEWNRSESTLRAVASDLDGLAPGASVADALSRLAATMACHAAVKANDLLTREKMQYLLDELRRTAHSSVCPHGRPVVLRLTRREIERNFDRV